MPAAVNRVPIPVYARPSRVEIRPISNGFIMMRSNFDGGEETFFADLEDMFSFLREEVFASTAK